MVLASSKVTGTLKVTSFNTVYGTGSGKLTINTSGFSSSI